MDAFLKMDLFFIVATAMTAIIGALVAVLLFYAIRVARTLDRLSSDIASEAHAIKEDFDDARLMARREGRQLLYLVDAARKTLIRFAGGRARRRSSSS